MTFPNLSAEKTISLDLETSDPSIGKGLGSGARRGGKILGIGVAVKDREWYFPIGHKDFKSDELIGMDEPAKNLPLSSVISWLRDLPVQVVGANILYDLDYTQYENYIPKVCHDIQFAAALLNEEQKSYSLDTLAELELGERKKDDKLKKWCEDRGLKGKPQEHIELMPVSLVAEYCAKGDCRQTYDIFEKQVPRLREEGLMRVYDLERSLIPVLLKMKRTGVRIDLKKHEALREKYLIFESASVEKLLNKFDIHTNENGTVTNEEILRVYKKLDLPYILSDKGNASFDKYELLKHGGELGALIVEHRHIKKMQSTYIDGITKHMIDGRVHPEFNPLRSDLYGTRIGRFSSSNPNLQQIPRADDEDAEQGDLIRSMFIPEDGMEWAKLDFSQMEMMLGIHFACGDGAEKIRERVRQNPKMDIYCLIASIFYGRKIEKKTSERDIFKTQSLGKLYNMSAEKLGRNMGMITLPENKAVVRAYWDKVFASRKSSWDSKLEDGWSAVEMDDYPYLEQYLSAWKVANKIDKEFPWMKATSKAAQAAAEKNGYVRTILGRKRRLSKEAAYKAFQAIDSGTGADIMKSAMLKIFDDGIMDVIPCHITCHDELDFSFERSKAGIDAIREAKNIMETIIPLKVKLNVEATTGASWGEAKNKFDGGEK